MVAWFGLVILAIINGIARNSIYGPHMNELTAHQVSTVTGVTLIMLATWMLNRFWPIGSQKEAVVIGVIWLVMTVAFEFLFGHYVMGHTWERLLQDYNILAGRIWILFLVFTAAAPYIVYRLK
jgi:uncharacterized membrane protein